jgi:hypothetical protein
VGDTALLKLLKIKKGSCQLNSLEKIEAKTFFLLILFYQVNNNKSKKSICFLTRKKE